MAAGVPNPDAPSMMYEKQYPMDNEERREEKTRGQKEEPMIRHWAMGSSVMLVSSLSMVFSDPALLIVLNKRIAPLYNQS